MELCNMGSTGLSLTCHSHEGSGPLAAMLTMTPHMGYQGPGTGHGWARSLADAEGLHQPEGQCQTASPAAETQAIWECASPQARCGHIAPEGHWPLIEGRKTVMPRL